MNALSFRRRYLLSRLWIRDALVGVAFIAAVTAAMWMLSNLAEWAP